jgi:hypothetical protein
MQLKALEATAVTAPRIPIVVLLLLMQEVAVEEKEHLLARLVQVVPAAAAMGAKPMLVYRTEQPMSEAAVVAMELILERLFMAETAVQES